MSDDIIDIDMPQVYLRKGLYDKLVQLKTDVTVFVNEAVEEKLKEEKQKWMVKNS